VDDRIEVFALNNDGLSVPDRKKMEGKLESPFEERGSWFPYIRQECLFDPLRGDPRFQDLVRRLNFPEH